MKILLVHNKRLTPTGEDTVIAAMQRILQEHGHSVQLWIKDNRELQGRLLPKIKAFVSGLHSTSAAREIRQRIQNDRPEIVHVHNIYPFFSPSILSVCHALHVPVYYHCHNHQFCCPTTFAYRHQQLCTKCSNGHEGWCFIHNCQGTRLGSLGYALRSRVARRGSAFRGVKTFIVPSAFLRDTLTSEGIAADRIQVVPNSVEIPGEQAVNPTGTYVAYLGRISHEKGLEDLLAAARTLSHIPFQLAGTGPDETFYRQRAPSNVTWRGFLTGQAREEFLRLARFFVVPSRWHEPFGLAAAEPMAFGKAVVATRRGGLPEIVQDHVTGRLVAPNDHRELAATISDLWKNDHQRQKLAVEARRRAIEEFHPQVFYQRLLNVYQGRQA